MFINVKIAKWLVETEKYDVHLEGISIILVLFGIFCCSSISYYYQFCISKVLFLYLKIKFFSSQVAVVQGFNPSAMDTNLWVLENEF